jgi:hypothetical protein
LHFMERIKTYNEEKFNYRIYKVSLNYWLVLISTLVIIFVF